MRWVMTGWLNMPTLCSNTTIQSLRDLSFTVGDTSTANLTYDELVGRLRTFGDRTNPPS